MKKLLILSGKGGTGKTTFSAGLIKLSQAKAIADCDVDAPNLHLVVNTKSEAEVFDFMGGEKAVVNNDNCIGCSACFENCRFDAIKIIDSKAVINEFSCEGCGVCSFVCPKNAIKLVEDIAGKRILYKDERVFSTATLKMGRGNSGKLVSDVKLAMLKASSECELAIIDGSPGIGCPVIASIGGMDLVLIVAEASESGISDLKRLIKTINSFQVKIAVCINKFDVNIEKSIDVENYCKMENIDFVGKIPFDPQAIKSVNSGNTIVDIECVAGKELSKIYNKILYIIKQ